MGVPRWLHLAALVGPLLALGGCGVAPTYYYPELPAGAEALLGGDERSVGRPGAAPAAPRMPARRADDNAAYNFFLGYLDRCKTLNVAALDVGDRFTFKVTDRRGRSLPGCRLTVRAPNGELLCERTTCADGRARFFPRERRGEPPGRVNVTAYYGQSTVSKAVDLSGPRTVELRFTVSRQEFERPPLDLAFIIDTTGSMGEELDKLKRTLESVCRRVSGLGPPPDARFALVLYRDRGEEYVTRVVPFTADIDQFVKDLQAVEASGGGDRPEALNLALRTAVSDLRWRDDSVRMAFLLADAAPHMDAGQPFTYLNFMAEAAKRAIKLSTIGAADMDAQAECVFRRLAQYTMGEFIFLTDNRARRAPGSASRSVLHDTNPDAGSSNLDEIIFRLIGRELDCLADRPVRDIEYCLQARPVGWHSDSQVLRELFDACARRLVDFAQVRLAEQTPTALVPARVEADCPKELADRLAGRLGEVLARQPAFKVLAGEQLKSVLDELDLHEWLDVDGRPTAPPDGRLGAELLVVSRVVRASGRYEMPVRLVRAATGEVLASLTLRIDPELLD